MSEDEAEVIARAIMDSWNANWGTVISISPINLRKMLTEAVQAGHTEAIDSIAEGM